MQRLTATDTSQHIAPILSEVVRKALFGCYLANGNKLEDIPAHPWPKAGGSQEWSRK